MNKKLPLLLFLVVASIYVVQAKAVDQEEPKKVEVTVAGAKLYALPLYAVESRYRSRNIIGTASRGAKLTVVSETKERYKVEIKADEDKVKVRVWIMKKDVK